MQVGFGDAPTDPESFQTVAEIVAEQRVLAERGKDEAAFETLSTLALDLHEWGLSEVALEVLEDLHGIVPPGTMAPATDAWVLNTEALALAHLGQTGRADALWQRMLLVGERLQDRELRAIALQNLATSDVNAGRLPEAKERARHSLALMREFGRTRSMVQLLNNLALINIDSERYDEAVEQLDAYEEMATAWADVHLLVSARGNRGRLLIRQGRHAEAEVAFRDALKLARKTGSPTREVLSLQNMGAVSFDQGRLGEAMRWYRKGIRLAETYHMPVQIEVLQRSLANVLHAAGRHHEAITAYDQAREAAWELGDKSLWAQSTMNIGAVYALSGDGEAAIDPLNRAASAFRELGEFDQEIHARKNMAAAYRSDGDLEAAVAVLEKVVPLLAADDHKGHAKLLRQAAEACLEDPRLHEHAVELFERTGAEEEAYLDPNARARQSALAAFSLRDAGAVEAALPFLDRAVATARAESSADYGLANALNDRGILLSRLDREDEASSDLLRSIELRSSRAKTVCFSLRLPTLPKSSESAET
jgi:tetratricopeptide (TPR) repeat protein